MDGEPRGIDTLFGQLFQSPEEGTNEIRNSSPIMQGQKKSEIQSLRSQKDEKRAKEA